MNSVHDLRRPRERRSAITTFWCAHHWRFSAMFVVVSMAVSLAVSLVVYLAVSLCGFLLTLCVVTFCGHIRSISPTHSLHILLEHSHRTLSIPRVWYSHNVYSPFTSLHSSDSRFTIPSEIQSDRSYCFT